MASERVGHLEPRVARIAPSILTADFGRLAEQVAAAQDGGADLMHLDMMDGHFVPPMTFGAPVVRAVREACSLPIEVHMMIANPGEQFRELSEAGAERLIFHYEAARTLDEHRALLAQIRNHGREAGIAINPETAASALDPLLAEVDEIVVMLIKPGWGGQQMRTELLDKVRELRQRMRTAGLAVPIEVDGGVKAFNAAQCVEAGAEILVAGSAVYNDHQTPQEALAELHAALGRTG